MTSARPPRDGRSTSPEDSIQRKRPKKNHMQISNLLSNTEDRKRRKSTSQRPDDLILGSNHPASKPIPITQPPQKSRGSYQPHNIEAGLARDSGGEDELFEGEFSRAYRDDRPSAQGGRMLNRWEGGSLSDWIHEQALYTNVASTGDSAEDVKKNLDEQAQRDLSKWKETHRNIHKNGVSLRYSTSRRRPSIISTGSTVSVPPSPSEGNLSRSASEEPTSRSASMLNSPALYPYDLDFPASARRGLRSNAHYIDLTSFIPNLHGIGDAEEEPNQRSHMNVESKVTETRPIPQFSDFAQYARVGQNGYTYPAPDFRPLIPDPQPPGPSAPPEAKVRKPRGPKVHIGPRKGGNSHYRCRIRDCGETVNMNETDTRLHLLDRHRAESFQDPETGISRVRCGWPNCGFGSPEKDGMLEVIFPRHVLTVHANPGKYVCPRCNKKSYTRRDALVRHVKFKCMRCKFCDTAFDSNPEYNKHRFVTLSGWDCVNGLMECKYCDATDFSSKRDYVDHLFLAETGKGCNSCSPKIDERNTGTEDGLLGETIALPDSEGNSEGRESMKEEPNEIQKPEGKGKEKEVRTVVLEEECEVESESDVDSEPSCESEEVQSVDEQLVEDEVDQLDEEEYD